MAAAGTLALVISPGDVAPADWPVHPAWIVALAIAARCGVRGLYAIPAVVAGVQIASWLTGHADVAMLARLVRPDEIATIIAIALVAAIGATHQTRRETLESKLTDAEHRASEAEAAIDELVEASLALRDRCDRSQTSLAVIADLAARMDDPNPARAGDAALALAFARTGARGGYVQVYDGTRLATVSSRGMWSLLRLAPPALFRDRVVNAAIERKRPVAAHEIDHPSTDDSDLAAPLLDATGSPIGVVALRGLAYPALTDAAREDLAAIARWVSRGIARPGRDAGKEVRGEVHAPT
jgi:hypothetical protein